MWDYRCESILCGSHKLNVSVRHVCHSCAQSLGVIKETWMVPVCSDSWGDTHLFTFPPPAPPEVSLYAKTSRVDADVALTCLATGFYPADVVLRMKKNESVLTADDGLISSGVLPNEDHTFQRRDRVEVLRSDLSALSCEVVHEASAVSVTRVWGEKLYFIFVFLVCHSFLLCLKLCWRAADPCSVSFLTTVTFLFRPMFELRVSYCTEFEWVNLELGPQCGEFPVCTSAVDHPSVCYGVSAGSFRFPLEKSNLNSKQEILFLNIGLKIYWLCSNLFIFLSFSSLCVFNCAVMRKYESHVNYFYHDIVTFTFSAHKFTWINFFPSDSQSSSDSASDSASDSGVSCKYRLLKVAQVQTVGVKIHPEETHKQF